MSSSVDNVDVPVMLPPGRESLATRPAPTGRREDHDGDACGGTLCRLRGYRSSSDDKLDVEGDELIGKRPKTSEVTVCRARFNDEILALDPTSLAQRRLKCPGAGRLETPRPSATRCDHFLRVLLGQNGLWAFAPARLFGSSVDTPKVEPPCSRGVAAAAHAVDEPHTFGRSKRVVSAMPAFSYNARRRAPE
jgi:hypothetical protein